MARSWVALRSSGSIRVFAVSDSVNHPAHYGGDTPTEPIKVIRAWGLGFNLGNVVKYLARAGKKGSALEDLKKARFYLDDEIKALEAQVTDKPREEFRGVFLACVTCGCKWTEMRLPSNPLPKCPNCQSASVKEYRPNLT